MKTKIKFKNIHNLPITITDWIGSSSSIAIHTIFFIGIFALRFLGTGFSDILLILTTAVSLEAIYLSIFIQMTVNRNTQSLEEVEEDIENIEEDIDKLEEEEAKDDIQDLTTMQTLDRIQADLKKLTLDIQTLRKQEQK